MGRSRGRGGGEKDTEYDRQLGVSGGGGVENRKIRRSMTKIIGGVVWEVGERKRAGTYLFHPMFLHLCFLDKTFLQQPTQSSVIKFQ